MHLKASRKNQQTPVHATNCLQRHGHPASPHSECSRLFFSAAVDCSTVLGRIEEVSRTLQTYKNQSHLTAAPTGTVSYTAPHNPSLPLLSMPCSQPVRPLLGTHSAVFSTCRAQHGISTILRGTTQSLAAVLSANPTPQATQLHQQQQQHTQPSSVHTLSIRRQPFPPSPINIPYQSHP